MGLLKGTLSFVRYRVAGSLPADFRGFADRQLKRFAFQEPLKGGEKSLGWTSLENPLDTGFSHVSHSMGDYLAFVLRVDRKVVPPSLLMIRVLEREKKLQEEKNRKKLYKNEREEIRNAVLLSCLSQIPPTPSFFEVCWNLSEGIVLFGGSGKKVFEDFEDLFKRTFQLKIAPLLPWENGDDGGEKKDDGDGSSAGLEFLSWLWFKSEERGGTILIPGTGDVGLIFVRRLVLVSGEGEYAETVTCQGLHADLREGKAALREGKKIREARLRVDIGTEQWECTLKAETFRYQSMKLPITMKFSEEEEAGMEGRFLERIHLVETLLRTVDRLFQHFMELRLSPRWENEEVPRVRKWLEE